MGLTGFMGKLRMDRGKWAVDKYVDNFVDKCVDKLRWTRNSLMFQLWISG